MASTWTAHEHSTRALPSEQNTRAMDRRVRRAALALGFRHFDTVFEHGHWWIILKSGEAFDAVDACGPGSIDGFSFEAVG